MLEKEIEKKLVEGIKKIGGVAFKFVSPGNDGVPDRIVTLPGGYVVFCELKTASGKLSGRQRFQIRRLKAMGFEVRVLHGLDEAEDFLGEMEMYVDRFRKLTAKFSGGDT